MCDLTLTFDNGPDPETTPFVHARLRNAVHNPGQSWFCTTFPLVLCATLNGSWMRLSSSASACGRISRRSAYLFSMDGSFGRSPIFSRRARPLVGYNFGLELRKQRHMRVTEPHSRLSPY